MNIFCSISTKSTRTDQEDGLLNVVPSIDSYGYQSTTSRIAPGSQSNLKNRDLIGNESHAQNAHRLVLHIRTSRSSMIHQCLSDHAIL
jgi:hypothetical protein